MPAHYNYSNCDPSLTLRYFTPRSSLVTWAFVRKEVKIIYFSKTVAAYDLKVGSYTDLNDLMKLQEYQRSRSLFDLPQRSRHF